MRLIVMPDFLVMLLTLVPWLELRGSIPVGLAVGLNPVLVFVSAVILNAITFIPIWICLNLLFPYIKNWRIIKWASQNTLKRRATIDKYGIPGLAIFVAIPLPFTGVWTATILAWFMRMPTWRSFIAISIGALGAGIIVFAACVGIFAGLGFSVF